MVSTPAERGAVCSTRDRWCASSPSRGIGRFVVVLCVCVCATLVIYETVFVRREDIVRETICDERASFKAFSVKIDFKRVVNISHTRAPSRKSVRKSSHCAIGTAE